jgi:peptidoglycan/xylan/chitin deacetylase (PgdA/CDA1 family)
MRLFRPFLMTSRLFPGAVTRIRTGEKLVWLTFDDGPDPASTPHILDVLSSYHLSAAFFCKGNAAEQYPGLMNDIRSGGHIVGNHGYSHIDGWSLSGKEYIADVEKAVPFTSDTLFRPPYGHITPSQYRVLSKKFRIILWDIMPYDFDAALGPDDSLHILLSKMRSGSVIVLHDNKRSLAHRFLDEFIARSLDNGYSFIQSPDMLRYAKKP